MLNSRDGVQDENYTKFGLYTVQSSALSKHTLCFTYFAQFLNECSSKATVVDKRYQNWHFFIAVKIRGWCDKMSESWFQVQHTTQALMSMASLGWVTLGRQLRVSPLAWNPGAPFFAHHWSLLIDFTRVSPPGGCYPAPFFTCPTSFLHYSL